MVFIDEVAGLYDCIISFALLFFVFIFPFLPLMSVSLFSFGHELVYLSYAPFHIFF